MSKDTPHSPAAQNAAVAAADIAETERTVPAFTNVLAATAAVVTCAVQSLSYLGMSASQSPKRCSSAMGHRQYLLLLEHPGERSLRLKSAHTELDVAALQPLHRRCDVIDQVRTPE